MSPHKLSASRLNLQAASFAYDISKKTNMDAQNGAQIVQVTADVVQGIAGELNEAARSLLALQSTI